MCVKNFHGARQQYQCQTWQCQTVFTCGFSGVTCGFSGVSKTLALPDNSFLGHHKCDKVQTMHDGTTL